MGLFDVFKKNDNSEGGEYHSMERSSDAPTAEEVRQAVDTPAPAPASAGQQPPQKAQQASQPMNTALPAITPNKLMSVNHPDILKREDSARVLGYFIERYDSDKTVANLQNCMNNFMDVWLNRFQIFRRDRTAGCSRCVSCPERFLCGGDSTHTWDFEHNKPLLCFQDYQQYL